jgi:hypothetical protein
MYHYIYFCEHPKGYNYFGKRSSRCLPEEDIAYLGSGIAWKNVLRKHGIEGVVKTIVEIFDDEKSAYLAEEKRMDFYKEKEGNVNIASGGSGDVAGRKRKKRKKPRKRFKHREETKKKIGLANTGKRHTEETKKILREAKKKQDEIRSPATGLIHSEETKKKIRNKLLGRKNGPPTEETKKKISNAKKGKPSHNKGKQMTEDQKNKIGISNKGKKRTKESKEKMKNASLKKKNGKTITNEEMIDAGVFLYKKYKKFTCTIWYDFAKNNGFPQYLTSRFGNFKEFKKLVLERLI